MLSVGGLTLYPIDYRTALASSLIPPPLPRGLSLQGAYPCGETTGLLRSSSRSIRGLGRAFRPVVLHPRQGSIEPLDLTTYRLVQASQHLRVYLRRMSALCAHLVGALRRSIDRRRD